MSELKQDIEKVAENLRAAEGFAEAAKQRALSAVNRQVGWIEAHPKLTLGISLGLLLVALAALVL